MNFVKPVIDRLQKYEFSSAQEAGKLFGDIYHTTQEGERLRIRVGFGNDGFQTGGIDLALPGMYTLYETPVARMRLPQGFSIDEFTESYSRFFDGEAKFLLLKGVSIDKQKRALVGEITLEFAWATHVLFIQPLEDVNRKLPSKTRRNAILNIRRKCNPDYHVCYLALPISYCEKREPHPEFLRGYREYNYIVNLFQNYMSILNDPIQNERNQQAAEVESTEVNEPPKPHYVWEQDYGEQTGERWRLLHHESKGSKEVNYCILPDGKFFAPDDVEPARCFAESTVSEYQVWKGIPNKSILLKYYCAGFGKVVAYDILQYAQDDEYTELQLLTIKSLQSDLCSQEEQMRRNAPEPVFKQIVPTWFAQIDDRLRSFKNLAEVETSDARWQRLCGELAGEGEKD